MARCAGSGREEKYGSVTHWPKAQFRAPHSLVLRSARSLRIGLDDCIAHQGIVSVNDLRQIPAAIGVHPWHKSCPQALRCIRRGSRMDAAQTSSGWEGGIRGQQIRSWFIARGFPMVNRDVLATFPCRVRHRGQVLAASPGHLLQPPRRLHRCRSLSDYRRAGGSPAGLPRLSNI
jgi:hypothetical protein